MAWKQGTFDHHLDVTGEEFIQGAVTNGATVHDGGMLIVQGAMAGPLTIEEGGAVAVQGAFASDVLSNRGVLTLAGVVSTALPSEGVVLVNVGTVFSDSNPPGILGSDGELEYVQGDVPPVNVTVGDNFRLLPGGRFERVPD